MSRYQSFPFGPRNSTSWPLQWSGATITLHSALTSKRRQTSWGHLIVNCDWDHLSTDLDSLDTTTYTVCLCFKHISNLHSHDDIINASGAMMITIQYYKAFVSCIHLNRFTPGVIWLYWTCVCKLFMFMNEKIIYRSSGFVHRCFVFVGLQYS